ncbi:MULTISPECIES: ATP-dependent RNA helicase DbpA [unclassified Rhodanobacter]|uniref:ATP-dependent RNA helicase DbpA n=1 Tax=unclassified Rhodanobacter TaxID=2621553 RepID=UPI0007A9CB6F|nr:MULTISPECIES: ATP-dependent RNA helicase DbpA [unclassified Rhodanobacter]KZC15996.1 ATP-dependent RNA helicase [Rhodanobacter sp. FW104-R8]KZC25456.1 ATP-dependent RNA helicase [Rhodanobacter sp. FW510-T8]KZC32254.1 ATP-dependent RNA helicase [Rhodanobacter sp. FW510-R10]
MTAFSTLPLKPALLASVDTLGYAGMTPVQAQSLPPMLQGRDVIAQAQTGSGKTAAFGLGLLQALDADTIRLQALVLCPTRELADQVSKAIRKLAANIPNVKLLTLCGGMPLGPQLASLTHDPHIVVGTPGRVQEHLKRGSLHGGGIKVLVLDEADRMLDMGFAEAIDDIVGRIAKHHQTLLFSATYPDEIRAVSQRVQNNPVEVTVEAPVEEKPAIEQQFIEVEPAQKLDALAQLLAGERGQHALVFCNMRKDVDAVAQELDRRGYSALALHGDMEQRDRDEVLVRFANRSCNVLVATDVAARGLDIVALPLVLSYDVAHDPDTHTHRIGRTGRAGEAGLAITLCTPRERPKAANIEELNGAPLPWRALKIAPPRGKTLQLAPMKTLVIDAGRQDKLRPGDILGALTGAAGLEAKDIGKIDVFATRAYVAIGRALANKALERLRAGRIKGRNFRVRPLG